MDIPMSVHLLIPQQSAISTMATRKDEVDYFIYKSTINQNSD